MRVVMNEKAYRRIEITAFRRRTTIISAGEDVGNSNVEVSVKVADRDDPIDTESSEGQEILLDAVRVLEERILRQAKAMKRITELEEYNEDTT